MKSTKEQLDSVRKIMGPSDKQIGFIILPFGKYAGLTLSEVAAENMGYIHWLSSQRWLDVKTLGAVKTIITNSKK